jgi:hypothetical protein
MDVANNRPGDEVDLTLQYSELLVPTEGVYELVYPTVVGPRYGGDPLQAAPDADWIANPYALDGAEGSNPAEPKTDIRVRLASPIPVRDLQSAAHKIVTHWTSDTEAEIGLDPSETQAGNRDFILRFRLQGDRIASGLMTANVNGEDFFLLMAEPPQRVSSEQCSSASTCSWSMSPAPCTASPSTPPATLCRSLWAASSRRKPSTSCSSPAAPRRSGRRRFPPLTKTCSEPSP